MLCSKTIAGHHMIFYGAEVLVIHFFFPVLDGGNIFSFIVFSVIKIYCIVLQVPNNVVSYVITGGDGNPLEYFFIHPSTGVIVLQKSVKSISTSNFRVWVLSF